MGMTLVVASQFFWGASSELSYVGQSIVRKIDSKKTLEITILNEEDPHLSWHKSFYHHLGYRARQDQLSSEGHVLYDVKYELDEMLGRTHPTTRPLKAQSHLIVAGCSFVFGEGLNADAILAEKLQQSQATTAVYNVTFVGGGVQDLIHYFSIPESIGLTRESKGALVYFFIPQHFARWFAKGDYLDWVTGNRVRYRVAQHALSYEGTISEDLVFQAHGALKRLGFSGVVEIWQRLARQTNLFDAKSLENFAEAVSFLKQQYLSRYPDGEFYTVMHPLGERKDFPRKLFIEKLESFGVTAVDAREDFESFLKATNRSEADFRIPGDGHPNSAMNEYLAEWLKNGIDKWGDNGSRR
jgi:hypothetical protein